MKQHITIEQLNELSEKGKERLRVWMLKTYPIDLTGLKMMTLPSKEEATAFYNQQIEDSLLLSIGQMIEFLIQKAQINIRTVSEWHGGGTELVVIAFPSKLTETALKDSTHVYKCLELCDALWEAVKEQLEK